MTDAATTGQVATQPGRNLARFLDGTTDLATGNTNVWRLNRCVDEALADTNMQTVMPRIHDAAFTRMAGSSDWWTPFALPSVDEPSFTSGLTPHPYFEL